jgi:glutathionylspermidine synthase
MQRCVSAPRPDWREKLEAQGLVWHTPAGLPYWNEDGYYSFRLREIEEIEAAARELCVLFVKAGEHVVSNHLFERFSIPQWCWPLVVDSWKSQPPALNHGRFDLGFDGASPPKLFEFNCDTPTALLETAVIQWQWLQDCYPTLDQFNSLHDKLVARWRRIAPLLEGDLVHFAYAPDRTGEDAVTTAYLMDTAREAGLAGQILKMNEIGWGRGAFCDLQEREIGALFHLYPWEWLVNEPFGRHIAQSERTHWIEPIWKMIWSNKAILPILWELFPGHPNLLPAWTQAPTKGDHVRKPTLAREGANIRIVRDGREVAASSGPYGGRAAIYQELFHLPCFDGAYPVIGAWVVDGEPAGMGIREDGLITGNLARFAPHVIDG